MTLERARRLRSRSLLAVECLLAALLPAVAVTGATAGAREDPGGDVPATVTVTVMTQNLFIGTGLGTAFGASSEAELVAAGGQVWAGLLASDPATRAGAVAAEIARARPDVVGLQEVTLWRDQTPGDALTQPAPDAEHVAFDFLVLLQDQLSDRGVPYTAVATSTGADLEVPRLDPAAGLVDLRLTDRDVLMVRTDLAGSVGNPRDGRYTAQFSEPFRGRPFPSTRGWTSIDYRLGPGTTVRILETHLEVADPVTGTTQEQQAGEFAALVAASPHPVIALGDFNAPADGSSTPTFGVLTASLSDAWRVVRPADPGWTCCQAASLADPVGRENVRLDLVLASPGLAVAGAERTGDRPIGGGPPLWASDHFGVTARIVVPVR